MIVSHQHRFIFIKTEKTAGTTMEAILAKACGPADVITPKTDIPKRNYRFPIVETRMTDALSRLVRGKHPLGRKFHNHTSAAEAKRLLGSAIFDSYFKFTIVRHPYERVISLFFWERQRQKVGDMTIEDYVRANASRIADHWTLYGTDEQLLVDDYIFYETLEAGARRVFANLNLPVELTEGFRQTKHKGSARPEGTDYRSLLTTEAKLLIYLLCKREFETFGYKTELDGLLPGN